MELRPPFWVRTTTAGGRGSGQAASLFDLPFAASQLCKSQPAANASPLTKPERLRWNFALPFGCEPQQRWGAAPAKPQTCSTFPFAASQLCQSQPATNASPLTKHACGSGGTSPSLFAAHNNNGRARLLPSRKPVRAPLFPANQRCKSQPAANASPLTKPVRLRWNFALPRPRTSPRTNRTPHPRLWVVLALPLGWQPRHPTISLSREMP